MIKKNDCIHLGHCALPHGIRGEFTFVLYNKDETVLANNKEVFLFPRSEMSSLKSEGTLFKISKINIGNKVIVSLDGISDRNSVEAMIPFDIYFEKKKLPQLDKDEYYLNDLLGLHVFDFYTKELIGKISGFYENGAQVILEVKKELSNEIVEILFIDAFVPIVECDKGRIEVRMPEIVE